MTSSPAAVLGWAIGIAALSLAVAELSVRWWIRRRGRHLLRFPGMRAIYDVEPGLADTMASRVRHTVNSEGARGAEPPPRGERCFRVTLVGGSAAESGLLSDDRCLVGLLHQRLNDPEVLRGLGAPLAHAQAFAASLVDTRALLGLMEATLPRLPRQDVMLLMTGASDFLRWLLHGAPSGRAAPPLPPGEFLAQYPEMPFSMGSPALRHAAKRLAFGLLHRTVRRTVGQYPLRERVARRSVERFVPLPGDPTAAAESYRRHLMDLIATCRRKANLVVVVLPGFLDEERVPPRDREVMWLGRLGSPRAEGPPQFVATADVARLFRLASQIARETAQAMAAPIADLGTIEASLVNYYDDAHLTGEGAERAATLVVSVIQGVVASGA